MAGWPKEKIDLTQQVAITGIWTSIAFSIAHLLFLLWLGRYFRRAKPGRSEEISPETTA